MNWTCEQTEARLSDYLEGLLSPAEKHAFDLHVNACERCTPLVASVSSLLSYLHSMKPLETPPHLVYSILDKTVGPRETAKGWRGVFPGASRNLPTYLQSRSTTTPTAGHIGLTRAVRSL